jgi:ATP-dependent RNA helicase DeaD
MSFTELGLPPALVQTLAAVGYETPSPIQAQTIPPLLAGRDVLGTAQTGTGKTAAFALPILARLDLSQPQIQALVLTPTRELAVQVAEAFERYAVELPGVRVLSIYGGQPYGPQLQALKRRPQVIVGTPGRVKDHLERGTLRIDGLTTVVLDEADEMLRMGFVEEVDLILERTPPTRQVALFSATMPAAVRRIAQTHLKNPAEITIAAKTRTATDVRQRYWYVTGMSKQDGLVRLLQAEAFDAMIVFTRTKASCGELAETLINQGFAAAALHGDMVQAERERTVERLKNRQLDIVVATDVAARGLDVERISHVLNFDIPTDTESYIHRIGRTGRAGRSGEAILFVTPREKNLLRLIERATRQPIAEMRLPSIEAVQARRVEKFRDQLLAVLAEGRGAQWRPMLDSLAQEQGVGALDLACALAALQQGDAALTRSETAAPVSMKSLSPQRPASARAEPAQAFQSEASPSEAPPRRPPAPTRAPAAGVARYRVEVGSAHGVKPGQIVGAIANEADLDSQFIGRIEIFEDYSWVDLPEGMPKAVHKILHKAWVCGRQLQLRPLAPGEAPTPAPRKAPFKPAPASGAKPGFKGKPRPGRPAR